MHLDKTLQSALARGSIGSFSLSIFAAMMTIVLHVLLTRFMHPDEYSAYAFAYTWISLCAIFAPLGFDTYLVRMVPIYFTEKKYGLLSVLVSYARRVSLYAAVLILMAGLLLSYFLVGQDNFDIFLVFVLAFISVPMLADIQIRQSVLRGIGRPVVARLPDVVLRPVLVALFVVLAYGLGGLLSAQGAMASMFVGITVTYIIGRILLSRIMPPVEYSDLVDRDGHKWVQESLPFLFISGLHVSLNYVDTLMVGMLAGIENVGAYSIAVRISEVVLFALQAINMVAAPMISRMHAGNDVYSLQALVTKVSKWIFFITLPLVLIVIIMPKTLLAIFGEAYVDGYMVLVILALGQLVNASVGPVGYLMNMTGHQNQSMKVLFVILGLNIVLNIPAIYYFGIIGAALVTSSLIAVRNIVLWSMSKRLLGVDSSILFAIRQKVLGGRVL